MRRAVFKICPELSENAVAVIREKQVCNVCNPFRCTSTQSALAADGLRLSPYIIKKEPQTEKHNFSLYLHPGLFVVSDSKSRSRGSLARVVELQEEKNVESLLCLARESVVLCYTKYLGEGEFDFNDNEDIFCKNAGFQSETFALSETWLATITNRTTLLQDVRLRALVPQRIT